MSKNNGVRKLNVLELSIPRVEQNNQIPSSHFCSQVVLIVFVNFLSSLRLLYPHSLSSLQRILEALTVVKRRTKIHRFGEADK